MVDPRQFTAQCGLFTLAVLIHQIAALEGMQHRKQLEGHDGKAPDVGVRADAALAAQQLRRAVVRGVELQATVPYGVGQVVAVDQPDFCVLVRLGDEHVLGREIAMRNAQPVQPGHDPRQPSQQAQTTAQAA